MLNLRIVNFGALTSSMLLTISIKAFAYQDGDTKYGTCFDGAAT